MLSLRGTASRRRIAELAVLSAAGVASLAGCGAVSRPISAPPTTGLVTASTVATTVSGQLRVIATSEASPILGIANRSLRMADPAWHLQTTTAPPGGLVEVARLSKPGLVVSSDRAALTELAQEGVTYQPVAFIRTKLQLVVAPADRLGIRSLADLEKPGVRTVVVASTTLTGQATEQLFGAEGLTIRTEPPAASPAAAVAAIQAGRADASLLEVPDAIAAGSAIRSFDLPDDQNVVTTFFLALPRTGVADPLAGVVANALIVGVASQALTAANYLLPASTIAPEAGTPSAG